MTLLESCKFQPFLLLFSLCTPEGNQRAVVQYAIVGMVLLRNELIRPDPGRSYTHKMF